MKFTNPLFLLLSCRSIILVAAAAVTDEWNDEDDHLIRLHSRFLSPQDLEQFRRHLRGMPKSDETNVKPNTINRRISDMMDGGDSHGNDDGGMMNHGGDGGEDSDSGGYHHGGNMMGGGGYMMGNGSYADDDFPFQCGSGGWGGMPMHFGNSNNMGNYSGPNYWSWMPMIFNHTGNTSDWGNGWWFMMPNMTNVSIPDDIWNWMPMNPFPEHGNGTSSDWSDMYDYMLNITSNLTAGNDWDWEHWNNMMMNHSGYSGSDWQHNMANFTGGWNSGGHMHGGGMMNFTGWDDDRSNTSHHCGGLSPDEQWRIMFLFFNVGSIQRVVSPIEDGVEATTTSDNPQVALALQQHVADMTRNQLVRGWDPLFYGLYEQHANIHMDTKNISNGVHVIHTGTTPCAVDLATEHSQVVSAFVDRGMVEMMEIHSMPASCQGVSNATTNETTDNSNLDESGGAAASSLSIFGFLTMVGAILGTRFA